MESGAQIEVIPPAVHPDDHWALDPEARAARIEEEMEARLRLSRLLLKPENDQEREDFIARCAKDPCFFARHVIWTMDPERNISGKHTEIPMIPFAWITEGVEWKGRICGGWLTRWHQALQNFKPGTKVRLLEEKTRRMSLSIASVIFYLWGLRFHPGFHVWMSSDNEEAIDHGEDWDAWFAKLRSMWRKAHQFYPWLYPDLGKVGSSYNKERYIEFAPWRVGDKEVAKECWGNKVRGLTPNEVSGRGGASIMGFIDEAGWIEKLDAFLDNIEQMTPFLVLASTPPADAAHPYATRADGEYGYDVSSVHWIMSPVTASGLYWDEEADYRGPWTERWRSPAYNEILRTQPTHVVARNHDLDYRSVAGDRVFTSFTPAPSTQEDTDLWDPRWPLEIWYDVGRRDPWACLWVQVSDATGEVRIVDYWMRSGVSVEWWIPIWLGWNPDNEAAWRTFPDMRPWKQSVPWRYGPEDKALMRRWHRRFGGRGEVGEYTPHNTLRPRQVVQDAAGKSHSPVALASVEEIVSGYGLNVLSSATAHNLDVWLEHANSVLTRTVISPHMQDQRPFSGGTRFHSLKDSFLSWRWLPATPREGKPKPEHSIHSHVCTAFVYGAMQLPQRIAKPAPGESASFHRRRLYKATPVRMVSA